MQFSLWVRVVYSKTSRLRTYYGLQFQWIIIIIIIILLLLLLLLLLCAGTHYSVHIPSTLNLSGITWKFRTIAMFVIVDSYNALLHTEFLNMFMNRLRTKFHMPSSNGSLAVAIKPKTKHRVHAAAMFFSILQKQNLTEVSYFRRLQDFITSGSNAPCTKFVRPPCCYYWLWEIQNYAVDVSSDSITFISNFVKIGHWFKQTLKGRDTYTPTHIHTLNMWLLVRTRAVWKVQREAVTYAKL
jgi:hypothetical protein